MPTVADNVTTLLISDDILHHHPCSLIFDIYYFIYFFQWIYPNFSWIFAIHLKSVCVYLFLPDWESHIQCPYHSAVIKKSALLSKLTLISKQSHLLVVLAQPHPACSHRTDWSVDRVRLSLILMLILWI